jgi:hypothetical protein
VDELILDFVNRKNIASTPKPSSEEQHRLTHTLLEEKDGLQDMKYRITLTAAYKAYGQTKIRRPRSQMDSNSHNNRVMTYTNFFRWMYTIKRWSQISASKKEDPRVDCSFLYLLTSKHTNSLLEFFL